MQCLPKAFCLLLDIPLAKMLAGIGHDGMEIIWPEYSPPLCYRSFHIQEIIRYLWSCGYSVTEFQAFPISEPYLESADSAGKPYHLKPQIFPFAERSVLIGSHKGIGHAFYRHGSGKLLCPDNGTIDMESWRPYYMYAIADILGLL